MSQQLTTQEVKKAHIRIDSIVFAFFRLRFNMPYTMEDAGHVPKKWDRWIRNLTILLI